ncbi:hypothetical protein AGLY_004972 [Aphis glycines]|uniref:YqaJ viral recombinase domain-containing protein n=1 Tax=Aphis glycines TaxID=307491 RepID=A0A6G0TVW4_APHGL|nr:hypothetical protein AGLY_004972 [Aphis glycines]
MCTCAVGQTKCNHMTALLLHAHKNISVTDKECAWCKQKFNDDDRICTINELNPDKSNFVIKKINFDIKQMCFEKLKSSNHVVGFTWLLTPELRNSLQNVSSLPPLESVLFSEELRKILDKKQFLNHYFNLDFKQIEEIAAQTEGQSDNIKWSFYRQYRITASNFSKVLKSVKRNRYLPSLFKTLIGSYNLEFHRSVLWGKNHEKVAIKEFKEKLNIHVQPTSIWLHSSGLIEASPDGLAVINGKSYCIEIKCPYKSRNQVLEQCLIEHTDCILKLNFNDNSSHTYILNTDHEYFSQIFMTKFVGCILVVWTTKSMVAIQIDANDDWKNNIDILLDFYHKQYVPWLLK